MRIATTILELAGYACIAGAAWMFGITLGLAVTGAALIVAAYGLERSARR